MTGPSVSTCNPFIHKCLNNSNYLNVYSVKRGVVIFKGNFKFTIVDIVLKSVFYARHQQIIIVVKPPEILRTKKKLVFAKWFASELEFLSAKRRDGEKWSDEKSCDWKIAAPVYTSER